jgi:hypothetical protein
MPARVRLADLAASSATFRRRDPSNKAVIEGGSGRPAGRSMSRGATASGTLDSPAWSTRASSRLAKKKKNPAPFDLTTRLLDDPSARASGPPDLSSSLPTALAESSPARCSRPRSLWARAAIVLNSSDCRGTLGKSVRCRRTTATRILASADRLFQPFRYAFWASGGRGLSGSRICSVHSARLRAIPRSPRLQARCATASGSGQCRTASRGPARRPERPATHGPRAVARRQEESRSRSRDGVQLLRLRG